LLASLRYDALRQGPSHPLHAAMAVDDPDVGAVTPAAFAAATGADRGRLRDSLATRTVQTNETSRAVAWLWPASLIGSAAPGRGIALVDLGTSAGLNLVADDLPRPWADEDGAPLVVDPLPPVTTRLGLDLAPLDPRDRDSARWLRACVWPGQRERLGRLDRAIEAFRIRSAAPHGAPRIERCDLADAAARLVRLPVDARVLALQTVVRGYLPVAVRDGYERSMRAWIESRRPGLAVWLEFEVDADATEPERSATLTARLTRRDGAALEIPLSRSHPHPRRMAVDRFQVERFVEAIAESA